MAATQRWRTTSSRPCHPQRARSDRLGELRGQSSLGPTVASATGRSVVATATLTSGMNMPAMPMLRRNGIGSTTSASSATATVVPLKTTAEPACVIALSNRDLVRRALPALVAPAHDDQQRVVDRDAEPDERDEELDDDRDVGDAGERPDEQERRRDRDRRHQQRHDRHERAEDQGEDDERAEAGEEDLQQDAHAGVVGAGAVRAAGAQRLDPRDLDGGPAHGHSVERPLGAPGLRLTGLEPRPLRDVDQRVGRAAVLGHERGSARRAVRGDARVRQGRLDLGERGVELRDDPGESIVVPRGSVTTGTIGATSPPLP